MHFEPASGDVSHLQVSTTCNVRQTARDAATHRAPAPYHHRQAPYATRVPQRLIYVVEALFEELLETKIEASAEDPNLQVEAHIRVQVAPSELARGRRGIDRRDAMREESAVE